MAQPRTSRSYVDPLRLRWRRLHRLVLARRRPLAAALAVLAVITATRAAALPATETEGVLVAARDLPSGSLLQPHDVTITDLPVDAAPEGAVATTVELDGRTLAAPLREGEPVTDVRLVAPGLLAGYPGLVGAPVRVADPAAVRLLSVGDRVDLLAVSPEGGDAVVVADAAPVVAVPAADERDGILGGALVVVAVPEQTARELAQAAVQAVLSVVLSR
jgi:Flp pilus assembly protein CpaB